MDYLTNSKVLKRHNEVYKNGYDHMYPNENIVRLVKMHFKSNSGKVLDFGFGCGENLIHLLKCGYYVSGIEISNEAKKLTEKKLKTHQELKGMFDLKILNGNDKILPYEDDTFDFILSNQTVYFLASRTKINRLINEFHRILKPGGKIIITMMSRLNTGCTSGVPLGDDVYEYVIANTKSSIPNRVYIIRDETHLRELFSVFKIDEIGYFDNYYGGMSGHHYVMMGRK
jgi:SAM-dependent methyltransferase